VDIEAMLNGVVGDRVASARAAGIVPTVLLFFSQESQQARAAYTALTGKPFPSPTEAPAVEEMSVLEVVSIPDACRVLREECDRAGAAMACHLEDGALRPDLWFVFVMAHAIGFTSFHDGERQSRGELRWDAKRYRQPAGRLLQDQGPSHLNLQTAADQQIQVFGPTGLDAAIAGALVAAVESGRMTFPDPETGRKVDLTMTDDALTELLLGAYGGADGPRQIAEALTALKKSGQDKAHKRLSSLLRNRPGLQELYARVRVELSGEAA
jgi:hypothetical protein